MKFDFSQISFLKKIFSLKFILWIGVLTLVAIVGVLVYSFVFRHFFAPPIDAHALNTKDDGIKEFSVQLDIYNASGDKGIALKARNYLRARGFDVVEIKNSDSTFSQTQIYDRDGNIEASKKIAKTIGLDESKIEEKLDPNLFLESTLIIGKDYKILPPFK